MMIIANQRRTHAAPVATAADWHDPAPRPPRPRARPPPSCFIGAAAYRHMQRSVDMDNDLKKAEQKTQAAIQEAHPQAREGFKLLLLSNPNYFGNLTDSPFQPILPISGNTHYEELGCVGYQPQQRQLEAVVYIYQPSGYGSGICGPGSTEHVRGGRAGGRGGTGDDQGLTSFQAYNIQV